LVLKNHRDHHHPIQKMELLEQILQDLASLYENKGTTNSDFVCRRHVLKLRRSANMCIEGVLISLKESNRLLIIPEGEFTCGCCRRKSENNEYNRGYNHLPTGRLLCDDCVTEIMDSDFDDDVCFDDVCKELWTTIAYDPVIMASWTIEDTREDVAIFRQDWNEIYRDIGSELDNEYVFCDGKNMNDLLRLHYGRRLVRNLRKRIKQKWAWSTYMVLRDIVGKDAAYCWTRRIL